MLVVCVTAPKTPAGSARPSTPLHNNKRHRRTKPPNHNITTWAQGHHHSTHHVQPRTHPLHPPPPHLLNPLPVPPSQSLLLSQLPQPTHAALQQTIAPDTAKIAILFKPLPSAPHLAQAKYMAPKDWRFEKVVVFLRKKLGLGKAGGAGGPAGAGGLFCYVNSKFSPAGDESVGNLFDGLAWWGLCADLVQCFKVDEQLVVSYCLAEAFG
ncbi:hypothetical protein BJ508DRAFT_367838 [Ascobolus immersus RN42]|uniref:Ubiquitin-like protein ATG12 n=1 Tax=Ascobolus immersus RN42 TaxID=1160509 RepID=A0A3N4HBU9_ASCIM|nr:hypothetical protein BJ508DRAFT_367838 [Ascobolus immersus RN42]